MLFGKKTQVRGGYDEAEKTPVIRCSICTGEQVAGLRRKDTGALEEVALIPSEANLQAFRDDRPAAYAPVFSRHPVLLPDFVYL